MSYNESKTVLRVEVPELKGADMEEAYGYFEPILGKADDVDSFDGVLEFFQYDEKNNDFVPVQEMSYKRDSKDDRWGVDYILRYFNDYGDEKGRSNHSIKELMDAANMLAEKFNVNPNTCRLVSYSWYNGTDEPIEFE